MPNLSESRWRITEGNPSICRNIGVHELVGVIVGYSTPTFQYKRKYLLQKNIQKQEIWNIKPHIV